MAGINYADYSVFSQTLSEVFISETALEIEECRMKHEFSPEFQRKIQKLIKKRKRPYYDLISTAGRRAACIGTAALAVCGMAMYVDAVRESVVSFVAEHFTEHDEFDLTIDPDYPYPESIERKYDITAPDGFVPDDEVSVSTPSCLIRSYKSDNNYIVFFQYTVYSFNSKINNQKSHIEYYKDKNGILYTIYRWDEKEGNYNVLWQKNDYVFQLNSDLKKDEVIGLCVNIASEQ